MRFKQAYKVQLCALKCCPELERLVSIQYLNINWNISQWKSYKNFLQKYCYASLCKYIVRNALQGLLNWQVYNFHYTLSQAAECWQINSHTTFKMKKNNNKLQTFERCSFHLPHSIKTNASEKHICFYCTTEYEISAMRFKTAWRIDSVLMLYTYMEIS